MNESKYLLCVKYDFKLVLRNRELGAFEQHSAHCSDCNTKVLITGASRALLDSDASVKPICGACAEKLNRRLGRPQYAVTSGHLAEMARYLNKKGAKNN